MKHAILITAYKNFGQLARLAACFDERFHCYIHIDRKSKISKIELAALHDIPSVRLVSRKYKINWGSFNHLQAELLLIRAAMSSPERYGYYHFITGQDYPVKSMDAIDAFFEANEGKQYMEYHKFPYEKWNEGGYSRLRVYNLGDIFDPKTRFGVWAVLKFNSLQNKLKLNRRYSKSYPDLYGGSTYWSLSDQCIAYIIDYLAQRPQFLNRFRFTFCCEEIIMQTILLNSTFAKDIINDPLRFIVWEERNGNRPANLDKSDESAILASNAIFARKIEFPVSKELVESLNRKLNFF